MSKAELDALIERARNLPPLTDISVLERPAPPPTVVRDYRPRDAAAQRYVAERAKQGIIVRYGSGQVLGVQ